MIIKHKGKDITNLVSKIKWSGSRTQAPRMLQFSYVYEPRDPNIELYTMNNGETIRAYDEEGKLIYHGNIYRMNRNTGTSLIEVVSYDNNYILNKSRTTRKFKDMSPEDITTDICKELGIKVGTLAKTGIKVSFIASRKTGYEIIMMAYSLAYKKNNKKYQAIMNGDTLDIIEKGTLIKGYIASADINTEDSTYYESIEKMVNAIRIIDEQGNLVSYEKNIDEIKKYSMIQDVYKVSPKKNTKEQVQALMKPPDRGGTLNLIGDYRVVSSYSIAIKDIISQLTGKFWIKSDTHTFENGIHEMRLEIEFENLMDEKEVKQTNDT